MLEKVGKKDIIVRDYTDNFSVKEYINDVLLPEAFPGIPTSKLNAGFTGVVGEYVSQLVEDTYATSSLMLNENFITRAILPNSIYSEAGLFELGYTFATPSRCQFAIQIWIDDILKHGQPANIRTSTNPDRDARDTTRQQYVLDRDTRIIVGENIYCLDYDIVVEWRPQHVHGKNIIPFKAWYDIPEPDDLTGNKANLNSIAVNKNRWITCRVTRKGWLILLVTAQEFLRKVSVHSITDNLRTTNSDITLKWADQIAGFDLVHINTRGTRIPMKKKIQFSDYETVPFVYYNFADDHTIKLSFSPLIPSWKPSFNDKIEATVYTTTGSIANFDAFDPSVPVVVKKSGERYYYNAESHIVAVCMSGSTMGANKKDIEMLRSDVKLAYNTVKVLSTDHDLDEWFVNFGQRHDTNSIFFKRRDDPTGRLFSQFVAITKGDYIYPTNTLAIEVDQSPKWLTDEDGNIVIDEDGNQVPVLGLNGYPIYEFDYFDEDSNEFIIKPGHLWEYKVETVTKNVLIDDPEDPRRKIPKRIQDPRFPGDPTKTIIETMEVEDLSRTTVVMTKKADGTPWMIYDMPQPSPGSRKFLFTNPFLIKLHRQPAITACYNYLIHYAGQLTEERIFDETEFRHFQLSSFTVDRGLIERGKVSGFQHVDKYTIRVLVNPILPQKMIDMDYKYVRGLVDDPAGHDYHNNNLRMLLFFSTPQFGETGYVEMYPIKFHEDGLIEYEVQFAVHDDVDKIGYLQIDVDKTADVLLNDSIKVIPDVKRQRYRDMAVIDASEAQFKFMTLVKIDRFVDNYLPMISADPPLGDPNLEGYQITNIFVNDHQELVLYKPMTMMRSTVIFAGKPWYYQVRADLMPFVAAEVALDQSDLFNFIRNFTEQYAAVEPVLFERLDNNCSLDVKLMNTYGRSNNYHIGDDHETHELLDDVRVKIVFQVSVYDRMSWSTTAQSIKQEIQDFFKNLNASGNANVYISNLIRRIEVNHPNVSHLKFLGINHYDAREQYIRRKYDDVGSLTEDELRILVPEIIQCLPEDIELIEER